MDQSIRLRKPAFNREEYLERFKQATGEYLGVYEPFKDEASLQQHLKEVEEAQKAGAPF